MNLQILDVYWENQFLADHEKATGTDGIIVKIGQGEYPGYLANKCDYIERAKSVGMPWGTYWHCDARYSPEAHKAAIKKYYPTGDFGPLGLWLDVEKPTVDMKDKEYFKQPYAYYKPIESFWRGIHDYTGVYPGIYAGPESWRLIMSAMPATLQQEFADNSKLWIAHYGVAKPTLVGKWTDYAMWQYTAEPDYSIANENWYAAVTSSVPVSTPSTSTPPVGTPSLSTFTVTITSADPQTKIEVK